METPAPPRLRVFLSSPGDVTDECGLACQVLQHLPKKRALQRCVMLEEISWDDPGAPGRASTGPTRARSRSRMVVHVGGRRGGAWHLTVAGTGRMTTAMGFSELVKKPTALGISRCILGAPSRATPWPWRPGGARNPHVFQHTLRLLVPSLGLAPAGLALRFAPGETVLRSGGKPGPGSGPVWRAEDAARPPFARDDFFTSSEQS
jgi:hypothetical protein